MSYRGLSLQSLPKQFPLNGWNILHAVAMGISADKMVLMIASSILIIKAATYKPHIYQLYNR